MANKKKTIKHFGMNLTEEEHEKWHKDHPQGELTPEEHDQLMERLGMNLTEAEHEKWHKEHPQGELTAEEQEQLRERLGVSEAEQRQWREQHPEHEENRKEGTEKAINPFAVGGGFLDYCVKQGWLIREGSGRSSKYYATPAGKRELANFGIKV
ncbi:MAG: hypothetical protein AB1656_10530 [Candidatus Omnitrophota bacterium]